MATGGKWMGHWLIAVIFAIAIGDHLTFAQGRSSAIPMPLALQDALQRNSATHTLLPDGRMLTLMGSELVLESSNANLIHPITSTQHIQLPQMRRYATATVVPDGRVLIWGGVNAMGYAVDSGLWFDSTTNSLSAAKDVELLPRAGHTATLLSDGRVLVADGWSSALGSMPQAEIWDPRSGHSQAIASQPQPPQLGQTATLLADGRVELRGGINSQGQPVNVARLFDATLQQFSEIQGTSLDPSFNAVNTPTLVASLPIANAMNFPADGVLSLRFSEPMAMRSINVNTITLLGPGGSTSIKVIGAQNGQLAFMTPASDLLPGAHYTLFMQGVMSVHGIALPFTATDFTVAAQQISSTGSLFSSSVNSGNASSVSSVGQIAQSGSLSSARSTRTPSAMAMVKQPALRLMTGGNGQPVSAASACGALGGSIKQLCRVKSYMDQGAWYPGQDAAGNSRDGHWRLNKPDITPQEVAYAALMQSSKGGTGLTGISGRIELIDSQPIANVDVSIGSIHVRTDARGNFSLTGVHTGYQWLYVDGTTANTSGHEYGQFVVGVNATKGVILPLSYRMYLPRILGRDKIQIPSPTTRDLVITHPDMPGLEIHIPAGTVIKDYKGKVVTQLAIVPTPVDRAPFPTPANFTVFFSIEPAGATIQNLNPKATQGIQIVYPNYGGAAPGDESAFYLYQPEDGWKVYSNGRVTADGLQYASNAAAAVQRIMPFGTSMPPPLSLHPGDTPQGKVCGVCAGDPVDLWSDTLEESQTDIHIDDVLPISLVRLFHLSSLANETRSFGGWRSNYDMYLYSSLGNYTNLSVRLPDGNLLTFTQGANLPGDSYTGTYIGSPSPWYGATLENMVSSSRCRNIASCFLLTLKDGTQFQFAADGSNGPTFIADRFGNQITLTYNAGLLQQITSPSGRFITLTYNSNNNIATATDNTGRTWSYGYTVRPNPALPGQPWYSLDSVTYPDLTAWHYTYQTDPNADNWGTLGSVTDRDGHAVVTNSYGHLPGGGGTYQVTNQTLADNTSYSFARAAPVQGSSEMDVTDPNGHVRKVVMDAASGYPVSVTEAAGTAQARAATYVRDSNGLINSMTDALLRKSTYGHDAMGNVTSITRLADTSKAVTQQFTYTSDYNQIATYSDGLGHTTTFSYSSGCLTSIKDPLGHTTTIACSPTGQPMSIKDALGHTTTFAYQGYDLRSVTDALNRTVTYTTDVLGRVIAVSDPLGNLSFRQYDVNDRVVKLVDPMYQVMTLVHDAMGNVTLVTLPSNGTIRYVYDARNRLIKRTDALAQFESWTPDGMGNVLSYTDRKGQSTIYQYDALDRPILTTYADSSTMVPTYDAGDRVIALSDSVSGNQSFGYDGLDRLTQAVNPQATVAYTYDAAGRRATMVAGTQASVAYTYDNANRITKLTQGSETVSLSYDNANRRSQLTLPNGVTVAYAYDNANQVIGITYKQASGTVIGNLGYGYDNGGRRLTQTGTLASDTLPTATTQPSTFDLNNRLTIFNSKTQTYDADGNLTGDGTNTYVWNARNQLMQVKQGGIVIATYAYDALGRRLSKAVNGNTPTTFLYDGLNPIQETQGTVITPILTGLGVDERYARTEPSGRTYFLTDTLGSTIGLTNTTGSLVQRYQYDPFGEVTAQSGSFTNPYQYTGRENDGDGLYYYRARYYSPLMKRFVGEDPIGFSGGQSNFYAAVGNNPLSYTDALGLRDVVVAVWTMDAGAGSVGHVFVGEMNGDTILSQFPHGPGGQSVPEGPNNTLSWSDTLGEEGRQPDAVYEVNVSDDFGFNYVAKANRDMPLWNWHPHEYSGGKTNCTVAAQEAFEDGGVPIPRPSINPLLTPNAFKSGLDALIQSGNPNVTRISNVPWN